MPRKTIVYPEWVEKYRCRGRDIRLENNGYSLYEVVPMPAVPGQSRKKYKYVYLGKITEKEGLIPKKTDWQGTYVEYGLSHMIWRNFKWDIIGSIFQGTESAAKLIVINYIFGSTDRVYLESSYLTYAQVDELSALAEKMRKGVKLANGTKTLEKRLRERLESEQEYNLVTKLLMLCVVKTGPASVVKPELPECVKEVLDKHRLKFA